MNVTITLGTWVFPLAFTITSFVVAWWKGVNRPTGYGGYARIGNALVDAFYWVPAVVLSLVAWLIWAVFFK